MDITWTRFLRHVDLPDPAEAREQCWQWTGAQRGNRVKYGALKIHGRMVVAHRYSYTQMIGPVPDGLELDHTCRNPLCVNPWHLEPVTHRENIRRSTNPIAVQMNQTHCTHGHALTGDNLRMGRNGTMRTCRACEYIRGVRNAQPRTGPAQSCQQCGRPHHRKQMTLCIRCAPAH